MKVANDDLEAVQHLADAPRAHHDAELGEVAREGAAVSGGPALGPSEHSAPLLEVRVLVLAAGRLVARLLRVLQRGHLAGRQALVPRYSHDGRGAVPVDGGNVVVGDHVRGEVARERHLVGDDDGGGERHGEDDDEHGEDGGFLPAEVAAHRVGGPVDGGQQVAEDAPQADHDGVDGEDAVVLVGLAGHVAEHGLAGSQTRLAGQVQQDGAHGQTAHAQAMAERDVAQHQHAEVLAEGDHVHGHHQHDGQAQDEGPATPEAAAAGVAGPPDDGHEEEGQQRSQPQQHVHLLLRVARLQQHGRDVDEAGAGGDLHPADHGVEQHHLQEAERVGLVGQRAPRPRYLHHGRLQVRHGQRLHSVPSAHTRLSCLRWARIGRVSGRLSDRFVSWFCFSLLISVYVLSIVDSERMSVVVLLYISICCTAYRDLFLFPIISLPFSTL